jgi:antitoxin CptB
VLTQLLALEDNDLMDLLIGRKDSVAALEKEAQENCFRSVLQRLREK